MRRFALVVLAACAAVSGAAGARAEGPRARSTTKPPMVLRPAVFVHDPVQVAVPATSRAITDVVGSPSGVGLLRMLGDAATEVVAPSTGLVGALVTLPPGVSASSLGLLPASPGLGRLRAPAAAIDAFALAHPELPLDIGPMLYPSMDRVREVTRTTMARSRGAASATGKGVLVGVADSGLDVAHHEFRDAAGRSRVRWLLDLSLEPVGRHPDLEARFAVRDGRGVLHGAVFSNDDLDELVGELEAGRCVEERAGPPGVTPPRCAPTDATGHGTHVTSIAAGSGERGPKLSAAGVPLSTIYGGIAPEADIVFVRMARGATEGFENDDFLVAARFLFDRADAEHRPMVANFSLGTTYGPHDGTTPWEREIASHVGPDKPGRAIIVAAGNEGSVVSHPLHQTVHVPGGGTVRVPIEVQGTPGDDASGSVKVWVTERPGSDLRIGLESPEGPWVSPTPDGKQRGRGDADAAKTGVHAGIVHGAGVVLAKGENPIPADSRGAVVVWTGERWPVGMYHVVLEGNGTVDLFMKGERSGLSARFVNPIRETTLNLPATHPSLIAVGATTNRASWTSIDGELQARDVALLDAFGMPVDAHGDPNVVTRGPVVEGQVAEFTGAGPTITGVQKPEIAAPGESVIAAMSRDADPARGGQKFSEGCAGPADGILRCRQIDATHGILSGTSMASPVVAGVVALLLERDPTLTQPQVRALLQGGAHRFRGPATFDDQAGPGEVDAVGSLDALERMRSPALALPTAGASWMTLSSTYVSADGTRPFVVILELRNEAGIADGFAPDRLAPTLLVDGQALLDTPTLERRGPGVWVYAWTPPPGLGGRRATFGATFDGVPLVMPRDLPIAADPWTSRAPSTASGSTCAVTSRAPGDAHDARTASGLAAAGLALVAWRRRARRA